MKQLISILFSLTLCAAPCQAQFGPLGGLLKGAKAVNDARKAKKKAQEAWGNTKIKDAYKDVKVDTTSAEYKRAVEEARQQMYESNPELKKLTDSRGHPQLPIPLGRKHGE